MNKIKPPGFYDMFNADILTIHADESMFDPVTGSVESGKAGLISYSRHVYYELGNILGHYGFSSNLNK